MVHGQPAPSKTRATHGDAGLVSGPLTTTVGKIPQRIPIPYEVITQLNWIHQSPHVGHNNGSLSQPVSSLLFDSGPH